MNNKNNFIRILNELTIFDLIGDPVSIQDTNIKVLFKIKVINL